MDVKQNRTNGKKSNLKQVKTPAMEGVFLVFRIG